MADNNEILAIIGNIPSFYHSKDLRNYFSQFIETHGFHCFHFRHRPEGKPPDQAGDHVPNKKNNGESGGTISTTKSSIASTSADIESTSSNMASGTEIISRLNEKKLCCVVKVKKERFSELIKLYNKHHWLDSNSETIPLVCVIMQITVAKSNSLDSVCQYKTRKEMKEIPMDRVSFTEEDLKSLIELRPPPLMPQGNVGTPTIHFLNLIQQCKLPPIIIKRLGLIFPKDRSNRKYGNVPFQYDGTVFSGTEDEEYTAQSATGHDIVKENCAILHGGKMPTQDKKYSHSDKPADDVQSTKSEEDADDCEEWERHEALHDDPANVERNKDRLFEEKIELKWEKGGSGLVFYTDAQYWKKLEGDFDEQTADDWDVDMSVYYERDGGDKDSRDHAQMRLEARRRDGKGGACINDQALNSQYSGKIDNKSNAEITRGSFEKHTKGIGRRVMEKQGWSDGRSLGSSQQGIVDALDSEGQTPRDKAGLGFHGDSIQRYGNNTKKRCMTGIISTIYDDPTETDPQEPLMRRYEPYSLKHRQEYYGDVKFCKAKNALE